MANNSQWLGISPLQGSGDGTITVSAGQNDGERRTCNIMVSTETKQVPVVVTQAAEIVPEDDVFQFMAGCNKISFIGGEVLIRIKDGSENPIWPGFDHRDVSASWSINGADIYLVGGISYNTPEYYNYPMKPLNNVNYSDWSWLPQEIMVAFPANHTDIKKTYTLQLRIGSDVYSLVFTQEPISSDKGWIDIERVTSLDESVEYSPLKEGFIHYNISTEDEARVFVVSTDSINNVRPATDYYYPVVWLTENYGDFELINRPGFICFENDNKFAAVTFIEKDNIAMMRPVDGHIVSGDIPTEFWFVASQGLISEDVYFTSFDSSAISIHTNSGEECVINQAYDRGCSPFYVLSKQSVSEPREIVITGRDASGKTASMTLVQA